MRPLPKQPNSSTRAQLAILVVMLACWTLMLSASADRLLGRYACRAWVVMDWQTGQVLERHQAWMELPPASLTKIMTALLVLDEPSPAKSFVATRECVLKQPVSLGIRAGMHLKHEELLQALLLPSANDAALSLAVENAGSVQAFVAKMNREAHALGLAHTHFSTPNGLYSPENYSCALDLAKLARKAMQLAAFRKLVRQRTCIVHVGGARRTYANHNRLLAQYHLADGIKTGYLRQAGLCLAASATRGDWRLIVILLDCPQRWQAAKAVCEYYFNNYTRQVAVKQGDEVGYTEVVEGRRPHVPVAAAETVRVVVPKNTLHPYERRLEGAILQAPVSRYSAAGRIHVVAPDGTVLGQSTLFALKAVPKAAWYQQGAGRIAAGFGLVIILGVGLFGVGKITKGIAAGRRGLPPQG